MRKPAPINAEPGDNRAVSRTIGKYTAEAGGWILIERARRVSFAVFLAIAFSGMLIRGLRKKLPRSTSTC